MAGGARYTEPMDELALRAVELTLQGGDRFAEVRAEALIHREQHGCKLPELSIVDGRELAVLVRATRASYVLELGGGVGYSGLNITSSFGQTGRIDTVEPDPEHARLIRQNFARFALEDRLRVHSARAAEVVPALSGPYDMIVINEAPSAVDAIYEDLVRLTRTNGSIVILRRTIEAASPGEKEAFPVPPVLARLAGDNRLITSFGDRLECVLATRVR
jgi:predicted O-methyltransferase YrrM